METVLWVVTEFKKGEWQVDKLEERESVNKNVVEWIRNRVESKYAADISMVLIYGSFVNGTANETSDVDCYFIPKTPNGYHMGCTFIIQDTGYDIFPMSWDRVRKLSELREVLLPLIGDAEIIYCHSEEDKLEFERLRKNMYENLRHVEYRNGIIRERFAKVYAAYLEMESCCESVKIRKTAGNIIMMLADIVALHHGDYFHFGLKKQYEDLCTKFKDIPGEFAEEYDKVIKSSQDEEYRIHCHNLLMLASEHVGIPIPMKEAVLEKVVEKGNEVRTDYKWLAGLYEEICSTFQKIYICCKSGNASLAFLSAVCLQRDLDDAIAFGGRTYDLLSSYQYDRLEKLAWKTREVERDYVSLLEQAGVRLKKYDSFEEFALQFELA